MSPANSGKVLDNSKLPEMRDHELSPTSTNSVDNTVRTYRGFAVGLDKTAPIPLPDSDNNSEVQYNQLLMSLPDIRYLRPGGQKRPQFLRTNSESSFSRFSKSYILSPKRWITLGKKKAPKSRPLDIYTIEYSVFKPISYLAYIGDELDMDNHFLDILRREGFSLGEVPSNFITADDFDALVSRIARDVEHDSDLKPLRISQGSSGSYFIFGKENTDKDECEIVKVGIFKPKDEEPYGPLSPKWSKWLHRTFFPCFFGRSCLIPNLGYISEAAACVLDRQLLSYIVPYTDIVYLRSPLFYYSFWDRTRSRRGYKIGLLQRFLRGYMEAQSFFRLHPIPQSVDRLPQTSSHVVDADVDVATMTFTFEWSQSVVFQFQEELEKLVILDYIMRNTDRGADNWMIKVEWHEKPPSGGKKEVYPILKVGAIDSGLAFPWKHPDEWRSFPFGWLFLPYSIIGQPFSAKTRQHYLPLLTSKFWWEQTIIKLKEVFQKDADFKERMWLKQIAVLKGQAFNVVEILKLNYAGPLELIRRENLLIWDDAMNVPVVIDNTIMANALESSIYELNTPKPRNWETSYATTEVTPLLQAQELSRRPSATSDISNLSTQPRHMSGFEYNVNVEDDEMQNTENETNVKRVVIERLEKVHSKSPVFTWC